MNTALFQWREIARIPDVPGVYAWYFSPEITDFDLSNAIQAVTAYAVVGNREAAEATIRDFLERFVFSPFREDPYDVVLKGPLKPRYTGTLEHLPRISSDLISRIIESPDRLRTMKNVLESSAPHFASPIYIGMSDNLRSRVGRHKSLIEQIGSTAIRSSNSPSQTSITLDSDEKDYSFARAICKRGIPPTRLTVAINAMDMPQQCYIDIENILNRIHFPLLGRN